jgi:hypothetical protein
MRSFAMRMGGLLRQIMRDAGLTPDDLRGV